MAADKSEPLEAAEHDSDTAEASVELPTSNVVDEAVTEMAMHEAPSASAEEPSASAEEPSASAEEPSASVEEPSASVEEPSASVEEPSASVEEPTEGSDVESETAADIRSASERATSERQSRASNDPREVNRREREAALRASGVTIASNANDQDTTDGSSSS
jgi:ribonuclease E